MTRAAGEAADGFFLHSFSTERSVHEITVPALRAGRQAAGHEDLAGFGISAFPFVVTGVDPGQTDAAAEAVRRQIAFYGSTPAYWPVFELHGWSELGPELNRLSKGGEWAAMGRLITDEVLDAFAIVAAPDQVAAQLVRRFGAVATRCGVNTPYLLAEDTRASIVRDLRAAATSSLSTSTSG